MIVNAYSVLAAFVGLVEVVLGVMVASLGVTAIRRRRAGRGVETDASASRYVLLFLEALVLAGVSVASWPLLYLVLASYVPEWPGVMCVRGVTRIGEGSLGAAGWLPTLVSFLEATKPALVFGTGLFLVLHLANRRTRTAPLTGRVLLVLAGLGFLAAADGAAQLAYLGIPKKESFLASGCCTTPAPDVADRAGGLASALGSSEGSRGWWTVAFVATGAAMAIASAWTARRPATRPGASRWRAALPAIAAALAVPLGLGFLAEVASPTFLGLEGHRCGYCLLTNAPLGVLAALLWCLGAFATGWASLARALAANTPDAAEDETRETLPPQVRALSYAALFGWLGAMTLVASQAVAA